MEFCKENWLLFIITVILCVSLAIISCLRVGGGNPNDKAQVFFMIKNNKFFKVLFCGFPQEKINGWSVIMQITNLVAAICGAVIYFACSFEDKVYRLFGLCHLYIICGCAILMLIDGIVFLILNYIGKKSHRNW